MGFASAFALTRAANALPILQTYRLRPPRGPPPHGCDGRCGVSTGSEYGLVVTVEVIPRGVGCIVWMRVVPELPLDPAADVGMVVAVVVTTVATIAATIFQGIAMLPLRLDRNGLVALFDGQFAEFSDCV
jgi:hypothetical protein